MTRRAAKVMEHIKLILIGENAVSINIITVFTTVRFVCVTISNEVIS